MKLLRKLLASLCLVLMLIFAACNDAGKTTGNTNKTQDQALVVKPQESRLEEVTPPPQENPGNTKSTPPKIVGDEELAGAKIEVTTQDGEADKAILEAPKRNDFNTEDYSPIVENKFLAASGNPLSTFSIDVDEAAYSNIRRYIENGQIPPAGAVRIEEMINYFDYVYPQPFDDHPFSVNTEISSIFYIRLLLLPARQ